MTGQRDITDEVDVRVANITLPTYEIGKENQNPVFHSRYGVAHIYPYTLLDEIASEPTDKSYRTLVLENRYLRVTVMPDLGGRVFSVFDKISEREVLYKNPTIKFSPLAIRGAFFSGGLEFSFPVAHAPTTADPINWDIYNNDDGSASICLGGIEHISRMQWTITLTLYPDRCALAQDVRLFNPHSIPGRYHYWTNASLDADKNTEFVYPFRRVRSYEFAGTASWPVARLDLIQQDPGLPGMEGVPMWSVNQLQEPINLRWDRNMVAQVSIFGRDVKWNFFGTWQHSVNHGYAHYASAHDVSGMKLWSWGSANVGIVNQTALMDDGSLYAETQCGVMETQLDFDFLDPDNVRSWREWWLPLRGLGGLTCASAEIGASIRLAPGNEAGKADLTVGVCPISPFGEANIKVSIPGTVLLQETVNIAPERPWLGSKAIDAKELAGLPINIMVTDKDGQIILEHMLDRRITPIDPFQPEKEFIPKTEQDYYQLGLKHENFDNRKEALVAYKKALTLAPDHGYVNLRMGLMYLRSADFTGANFHLRKAASLGLGEADYYLGIIEIYSGQYEQADTQFRAVPSDNPISTAALLGLGRIALRSKDWQEAIVHFKEAQERSKDSSTASLLLGMALNRAGQFDKARLELENVLVIDPLNHSALREITFTLKDSENFNQKLERLLSDDRQYVLDLVCFYMDAGLNEDALQILEKAYTDWEYPLIAYLAGYIYMQLGKDSEAQDWLSKGADADPDLVFPSRIEEVIALQFVIRQNPQDHKAKYYLGNFLYAHERMKEAVNLWEESLVGLKNFDVVYRNLGWAAWHWEKNSHHAIDLFEKALELNPQNQDLYKYLDELYKNNGLSEKRRRILALINMLPEKREDIRKLNISIMIDLGDYEKALEILLEEDFIPLEMDQSFHNVYVGALMQRAEAYLHADQVEAAIADYQKALEFPENLGVGAPPTMSQAHIYYQLGLAYEELGNYSDALAAWRNAVREHHTRSSELYKFIQMSLDKLSRYSELGFEF